MNVALNDSKESDSFTTLQQLPNEIQLMILKYLSLYDLYKSFFGINSRINSLLYHMTPKLLDMRVLKADIHRFEQHLIWYFDKRIWWGESAYYLIPQNGWYSLRWIFIPQNNIEQLKGTSEHNDRILPVILKYPIYVNTLFLIVNVDAIKKMYFRSEQFPQWIKDNYSEQHELIIESDKSWYTKEVCDAFREINQLERKKQEQTIHEQAKQIWHDLSESEKLLVSDLPASPRLE